MATIQTRLTRLENSIDQREMLPLTPEERQQILATVLTRWQQMNEQELTQPHGRQQMEDPPIVAIHRAALIEYVRNKYNGTNN